LGAPPLLFPDLVLRADATPTSLDVPGPAARAPLCHHLERGPLPLSTALAFGAEAAVQLAALHDVGQLHGHLSPASVGLAVDGSVDLLSASSPPVPTDPTALASVAPEQTGRLPTPVDERADLYALGTLLYAAIDGAPPFTGRDPAALVHAHLAHTPPRLDERHPETVPRTIADLVHRLLAKSPDDRYQTARGLAHDLVAARDELIRRGTVSQLVLGTHDQPRTLRFPQRLVGRDAEVAHLRQVLARCTEGSAEALAVTGWSGVGKSALVHTLAGPTAAARGWFCPGKFERFRRDTPYLAWVQAVASLVRQVLAESDDRLRRVQAALGHELGPHAGALVALMPDLALLLPGDVRPTESLGGLEDQARVERLFTRLLRALATADHPLVVFLDDLQWADAASLRLVEATLADLQLGHLLLVLGYRDREAAEHPLLPELLARIAEVRAVPRLEVPPLDHDHTRQLVEAVLPGVHDLEALSAHLFAKTRGNPFFLRQLLVQLHQQQLIGLRGGRWQADLAAIRELQLADDVAVVVAERLSELPEATRSTLALAACVGGRFDLDTLAVVQERSPGEVSADLAPAIDQGLLLSLRGEDGTEQRALRFGHDRVHEAAHALLPADQRDALHLRIGRLLLARCDGAPRGAELLDIVDHLAHGQPPTAGRVELAELNLAAARRARRALAFDQASTYVERALELLPPDPWADHHGLAMALHDLANEVAFHTGDADRRARSQAAVLEHATTPVQTVAVRLLSIREDLGAMRWEEGTDTAVAALAALGESVPRHPTKAHVAWELVRTQAALRGRTAADLGEAAAVDDPHPRAVDELLLWCATAGYFAAPDIVPLCGLRMTRRAAERGVGPHTAFGLALMGLVQAAVLEQTEEALTWADAADRLMQRFDSHSLVGKVGLLVDGFTRGWARPQRDRIPVLLDRRLAALDVGDETFAVYCGAAALYSTWPAGWSLPAIERRFAPVIEHAADSRQLQAWPMFASWTQLHRCLADPDHTDGRLVGEAWDWEAERPRLIEERDGNSIAHSATVAGMLAWLMGDVDAALADLGLANQWLDGVLGQLVVPVQRTFHALAHLSAADRSGGLRRAHHLQRAAFHAWRLRRWAARNPDDLAASMALVDAERQAVTGRLTEALRGWQQAIAAAQRGRRPHDEALARERGGRWLLRSGAEELGRHWLMAAANGWQAHGALAKAEQLRSTFGLAGPAADAATDQPLLDAVRELSTELELAPVLERVLALMLQAGGAQRVALVLSSDEGLHVVAERDTAEVEPRVLHDDPLAARDDLPLPVFDYVRRTDTTLYAPVAVEHELYRRCPTLADRGVRSLLCAPLRLHGQLRGLLYLEHRDAEHALDSARMDAIETLCAQATISIEHARLYADLEDALATARDHHDELLAAHEELQASSVSIEAHQKARAIAEAANRSKSSFLASMSHELRTPLNAIIGYSEMLADDVEALQPEQVRTDLQRITHAGNHLLSLINDVLDLSKIEADKLEVVCTSLSPADVWCDVVGQAEILAAKNDNDLVVNTDAAPTRMWADELRAKQVLLNLLSNAAKFTDHGTIEVRVFGDGDRVGWSVRDTGIGMTADQLATVFEAFQQAEATTAVEYGGTGLGLALSRRLARLMGGEVEAASEHGAGSTFTFWLPASPPGG